MSILLRDPRRCCCRLWSRCFHWVAKVFSSISFWLIGWCRDSSQSSKIHASTCCNVGGNGRVVIDECVPSGIIPRGDREMLSNTRSEIAGNTAGCSLRDRTTDEFASSAHLRLMSCPPTPMWRTLRGWRSTRDILLSRTPVLLGSVLPGGAVKMYN